MVGEKQRAHCRLAGEHTGDPFVVQAKLYGVTVSPPVSDAPRTGVMEEWLLARQCGRCGLILEFRSINYDQEEGIWKATGAFTGHYTVESFEESWEDLWKMAVGHYMWYKDSDERLMYIEAMLRDALLKKWYD